MNNGTLLRADLSSEPFTIEEVPVFSKGRTYTCPQLDQMATVMIYTDCVGRGEAFVREGGLLLSQGQWRHRYRHELLCAQGGPDPAYTSDRFGRHTHGMFWRSHPGGLTVHTEEHRRNQGVGFYA
jgi:hypothetical protein